MKILKLLTAALLIFTGGCASVRPPVLSFLEPKVRQALTVNPHRAQARLIAWQRVDDAWKKILGPVDATIGRNGFAPKEEKMEGDGRTPSGTFKIDRAFGYDAVVPTGLAYKQVSANDFWIDDPVSSEYNTWVVGQPQANSFERLKRDDDLYRQAIIIEYNTAPIIAGAGSAIFLHIWRNKHAPTAGCVAVSPKNIKRLLTWLDRFQNPVIILGNDATAD